MYYTLIGILAISICFILNHDIIVGRVVTGSVALKDYRRYLIAVVIYFVVDISWGVIDALDSREFLYAITFLYYITMATTVVLWCKYAISYLQLKNLAARLMLASGAVFWLIELVALIINLFTPIFFWIDEGSNYCAGPVRIIAIIIQIIMFAMVGVLSFVAALRSDKDRRIRHMTISTYGFSIALSVFAQIFNPLLPLYTVGTMIGVCLLHVFVFENERAEYRKKLQENEEKLRENADIIANAGYGIWKIYKDENGRNAMVADDKLKDIFGIKEMNLSPDELYSYYHGRLLEGAGSVVIDDYRAMEDGALKSRVLSWSHPQKGRIYILAGGTQYTTLSGQKVISGYCGDITESRTQELRSNLTINALARSYDFLNYISMETGMYLASIWNFEVSEEEKARRFTGVAKDAVEFTCRNFISPEYRKEMLEFGDLTTVNERMQHRHVLINQFKNIDGVWLEWSYIVADRDENGCVKHLIWAVRKIEDEKQAEIRKQQLLEDTIAANKAKTVFLQNMSHEIRTPLNAMFGFAQLLGLPDGSWTDEEKSQYNAYIYNSYNMLDMLIGDIIDVADAEHGNYRIDITDVLVNNVCRNAMMSVEYRVSPEVNLYFTTDYDDDFVVKSDARRIQQVLINYLTNACKNTTKGEIHLHCSKTEHPGKVTFSVTDTGRGVPEDKADIIFNRFTKLNEFSQGSGLGLNICLMVADKLGGEVYLDKTYKEGARFVFVIDDNA